MTAAVALAADPLTRPRGGYMPYLDGLRGVAIAAVLLFHVKASYMPGGFFGVDVFFVLSGYLITSLLLKEWDKTGRIHVGHFYMRRALRLLPALVVMLAILLVIWAAFGDDFRNKLQSSLIALFYGSNWARAFGWPLTVKLGHTWSLSIEEQFYLIWPPLFIGLMKLRIPLKVLGWLIAALAVAAAGWRAWLTFAGVGFARTYNGLDTHCDGLLVGCAMAFLVAASPGVLERRARQLYASAVVAAVVLLVLLAVAKESRVWVMYSGFFLAAVASAVLVAGLAGNDRSVLRKITDWPPLVRLGRISYGVYLWHWPIMGLIGETLKPYDLRAHGAIKLVTGIGLSLLVAGLSYRFLELPFLKLKSKWQ